MISLRLDALKVGAGLDGSSWSGAIHSVFPHACNIALGGDRLLSLVAREAGAVPRGFLLATPPGFRFDDHVRVMKSAACRNGTLRIEDSSLSVDLRAALPWRSRLAEARIDLGDTNIARAWRAAWATLAAHDIGAAFAKQAAAPIRLLIGATQNLETAKARSAVSQLIGLGDGLTPAGDDFLVGFMAGLWNAGRSEPHASFRSAMADAIAANATRTGIISWHYLKAAIEGEVSEPLANLVTAIGRGDEIGTTRAVVAALSVGASSGAAATHGLLLAAPAIASARRADHGATVRRDRYCTQ